ncbi:MAG: hypothetical protein P4L77_04690 [Sulfuriferula sp.]|nr:hypothetical protein [Sulfuriferula sp.]
MEKNNISPEKITKPIQLLGAWLVGLLAIDGTFLIAAKSMDLASWQSGALTIAAIVNVPLFIGALFLLQTKFRPELQEDSYYSTYLNNRTNEVMKVPKTELLHDQLLSKINHLESKLKKSEYALNDSKISKLSYGVNIHLDKEVDTKVENKLDELGIQIVRLFGGESNKPDNLIVAINSQLPIDVENEVLLMAKDLGFEYYSYIEPFEETEEDVLFGAYGKPEGKISIKVPKAARSP